MHNLFYKTKIRGEYKITRVLFFKFKRKLSSSELSSLNMNLESSKKIKLFVSDLKNIGKCTYTHPDLFVANKEETSIGSYCSLGMRIVLGHGEHPMNYLSTSPFLYLDALGFKDKNMVSHNEFLKIPPIHIGNDVWIGDGVFVKNGITIGDGAIIGARSVVTRDVPPYAIVAGVPARVVKYRFAPEIIEKLLNLKWWDRDETYVKNIPYDDIHSAIKYLEEVK